MALTADAVAAIHRGELDKVVLARQVDVETGGAVDVPGLLRRWHAREPNCTMFSLPAPHGRSFVGASPELLVTRHGRPVHSRPLAGTTGRTRGTPSDHGGTGDDRQLLESAKDTHEHRYVTEAIAGLLAPLCRELDVPDSPGLVHLHSVTHLATDRRDPGRPGR